MMISNLPSDLVTEILLRVPLQSLRAVRLTCKRWSDISKSQSFTKMHIDKAAAAAVKKGESQMIVMKGHNLYLKNIVINGDPYTEYKGKLSFCLDEQVKITQFFHCEGLLLCILNYGTKFVVWNPYLGQPRWIKPRYTHILIKRVDMFCYALGYENDKNKSCRRHKLLRFIDYHNLPNDIDKLSWFEIYDLDSDIWKTLDVIPNSWRISFFDRGVSVKGNTYWCATKERPQLHDALSFNVHIICFDFAKESFGSLLPLPFICGGFEYVTLSCLREEKLVFLLEHTESNPHKLDLWITTKIETEEVLWSKFLTVEIQFDMKGPCIIGSFIIDEEKKVAFFLDKSNRIIGENGYFRSSLDLLGEDIDVKYCNSDVCSYVPSLVQIKQPSPEEKKQESESEKLRFNENISRLDSFKFKAYRFKVYQK